MRRLMVLLTLGWLALGCSKEKPVLMTPGSRLIYHDGAGHGLWTSCDRGNRVYMTHTGLYQVVPGGCPDGQP